MLQEIAELEKLAERSGLKEKYKSWFEALKLSLDIELLAALKNMLLAEIKEPFAKPGAERLAQPAKKDHINRILLGFTMGGAITLELEEVKRNILVGGQISTGKTSFLLNIVSQLIAHGINVWVFDFKREYYDQLQELDVLEIHWKDLRINPFWMLDDDPYNNLEVAVRILTHLAGLEQAGLRIMADVAHELFFERFHLDKQDKPLEDYPSLEGAYELLKGKKFPRGTQSYLSADRVLAHLHHLLQMGHGLFDCSRGFPLEELAEHNIIFVFQGLDEICAQVAAESLIAALYRWKLRSQAFDQPLSHVVISDEAKHLFDIRIEQRQQFQHPYIVHLLTEARASGLGFIFADQLPHQLAVALRENSYTKVAFRLGEAIDIKVMADSMALDDEQRQYLARLDVGEAIVQIGREPAYKIKAPHKKRCPCSSLA
jgi:hypothetical protein